MTLLFEQPAGVFHHLIMLLLGIFDVMLRCRFDGLVVQRGCNQLDVSGLLIQLRPVSPTQLVRRDPVCICDPGGRSSADGGLTETAHNQAHKKRRFGVIRIFFGFYYENQSKTLMFSQQI